MTDENGPRSSAFWLAKADEAQVKANDMRDGAAERTMLEVARIYDQMAAHALSIERRLKPI
jgi:hypothetical protein